ncbi:hypothetical protein DEJ44_35145 [Streptomyces venezuelae]|uniref:hypothetical protein n=1 Tax=Streptomyces venezuelae TaxID=54571 RepID=UPI00123AC9C2|nr:hypothetical protein [Streptomyces venezuelae]QES10351.1 hypothetical protein DEJ44_35145 [Streptomyces venezuelae]
MLGKQLMAVYPWESGSRLGGTTVMVVVAESVTGFNLATRRINAGTAIVSRTAQALGLHNVRDAAIYAQDTLLLPVNPGTAQRYSRIIGILDDINANRIERY